MSAQDALNKRWQKLCADIAQEARRLGAEEPFIFASEAGLCVCDGLPNGSADVLFRLPPPPSSVVTYDSGGW